MSAGFIGSFVVGWIVSAIVSLGFCRKLAKEKGYSLGAWSVLGFFFSLLSLIAIAGLPVKKERGLKVTASDSGEKEKIACLRCGRVCGADDVFCVACGEHLKKSS